MNALTLEHVEQIAHGLAARIMEWDEPIPEFGTRFKGKLESCLQVPLQTFAQKELYPSLEEKLAILFYLLIKNHPFQNGNKRIAVTSLLTFLTLNGKWLSIPPDELYKLAIWVAESLPTSKDGTLTAIKDTIKRYLIEWDVEPFRDGMVLRSEQLNQMCKSINMLEQLMNLPTTQFRLFKKGDQLHARDLNLMMDSLDKIALKKTNNRATWKTMPVRDGDILKAATMSELWRQIGATVVFFKRALTLKP